MRVRKLIDVVLKKAGASRGDIKVIGLVTPGPMSASRGIVLAPPNMPAWRDVPVREWVEQDLGQPVRMNNDANAAGLADYRFGEFRGVPDLIFRTMSTGIGAGIISGGQLVQGATDVGGEVGHFVLDPAGPPCPCGLRGCFEVYCGGRSVIRQVRDCLEGGASSRSSVEADGGPEQITVSAIVHAQQPAMDLRRNLGIDLSIVSRAESAS